MPMEFEPSGYVSIFVEGDAAGEILDWAKWHACRDGIESLNGYGFQGLRPYLFVTFKDRETRDRVLAELSGPPATRRKDDL